MSEELKTVRVLQNGLMLKQFTCKYIDFFPSSVRFHDVTPRVRKKDGGIDVYYSGQYDKVIDINDRTAILMLQEQDIEIWINF